MACLFLPASAAAAQEPAACPVPPAPCLCLEQLARMSWPELEAVYRQAEPGALREGCARGRAIYRPDARFSRARAANQTGCTAPHALQARSASSARNWSSAALICWPMSPSGRKVTSCTTAWHFGQYQRR